MVVKNSDLYKYEGIVESIYDGDTLTIMASVGFSTYIKIKARLYGIDTAELRTKDKKEKELAYKARDYLRELILNKKIRFISHGKGKYGRYLCTIFLDGENINKKLVEEKLAKEYFGGKR